MKIVSLVLASTLILPAAAAAAPVIRVGAPASPIASLTLVPASSR